MNNSIMGECPRCNSMTAVMRPTCAQCGKWQEWGDQAVVARRKDRIREFRESEEREEAEWRAARYAPESRAPRLSPWHSWLAVYHTLHLDVLTFSLVRPMRALATAGLLVAGFAAGAFWVGHTGTRAAAESPAAPATIIASPVPTEILQPAPVVRETSLSRHAAPVVDAPTGVCNDGTPTRAGHRAGACSRHGGVREWYLHD